MGCRKLNALIKVPLRRGYFTVRLWIDRDIRVLLPVTGHLLYNQFPFGHCPTTWTIKKLETADACVRDAFAVQHKLLGPPWNLSCIAAAGPTQLPMLLLSNFHQTTLLVHNSLSAQRCHPQNPPQLVFTCAIEKAGSCSGKSSSSSDKGDPWKEYTTIGMRNEKNGKRARKEHGFLSGFVLVVHVQGRLDGWELALVDQASRGQRVTMEEVTACKRWNKTTLATHMKNGRTE